MQLVLLAVEKNLTYHLDFDEFVAEFNTSSRRIVPGLVCRLVLNSSAKPQNVTLFFLSST